MRAPRKGPAKLVAAVAVGAAAERKCPKDCTEAIWVKADSLPSLKVRMAYQRPWLLER